MDYLCFVDPLSTVLRQIRIGDFARATANLERLAPELPQEPPPLHQQAIRAQTVLLRLVALQAEVADHGGDYAKAESLLGWYPWVEDELHALDDELQRSSASPTRKLTFAFRVDPEWKLMRQKIYYLWQVSVSKYRFSKFHESNAAMATAVRLADELTPRAEGLRTQLFYGAGKLALHDSNYLLATINYRKSLVNAADLVAAQRRYATGQLPPSQKTARASRKEHTVDDADKRDALVGYETAASQYAMGKALALGLGQCLREQGRLEEAQMAVVAGQMLLDAGHDRTLAQHARLLLGSIERGAAGNKDQPLLESARHHLEECARFFEGHRGDVWFRSQYERTLVLMQQGDLKQAKAGAAAVLQRATVRKRKRWIANAEIALSRIARRSGKHDDAIGAATSALAAAEDGGFEKIERRARVALALARYAAAVADDYDRDMLSEAQRLVDQSLLTVDSRDLRNRVELMLLKASILNARGESGDALRVYDEYRAIGYLVESGRVRELASTVEKELFPAVPNLRCPADTNQADYRLKENVDATRVHVVRKVLSLPGLSLNEKARALGVTRQSLDRYRKELEEIDPPSERRRPRKRPAH